MSTTPPLSWIGILRLGLVQTSLGAIVVLTTSTMNRVMVVELALPAVLPGFLVALHYAVQMLRPRWGHGSDVGGRRTPWILGGMAVLALGAFGASVATAWMSSNTVAGVALAIVSFVAIGIGVGAAGTTLLALLAKRVTPERRPAAASVVWMMMIAGFVITAGGAGHFLDPFTPARLVAVTAVVCAVAFSITLVALWNVEGAAPVQPPVDEGERRTGKDFMLALREVWAEPEARAFTIFVFVSMLAYSAQDLILEPFAGLVFGMTPGETTKLSGVQHGGVLAGMILVALAGNAVGGRQKGLLRGWVVGGCIASSAALFALALSAFSGMGWPLATNVFLLGFANGAFAVAAIGSMMGLAGEGRSGREGMRMGLWGAAQAIAFGLGGFIGAGAVDLCRALFDAVPAAYATVFAAEAALFLVAAVLAARMQRAARTVPVSDGARGPHLPAAAIQPVFAQTGVR
jgi:BCD family chlorophyll transporter-like MFS transporter